MKKSTLSRVIVLLCLIMLVATSIAQDFQGGIVKYQQTTRYDFAKLFGIDVSQGGRGADFVASLPTEMQKVNRLVFTLEEAMYGEDPDSQNEISPNMQSAISHLEYMAPPRVQVIRRYHDLVQHEVTEQIEFMTRQFLLTLPMEKSGWKLTQKLIKVQNYTCMAAEMQKGDDLITAYFTSELPVSVGPAEYGGLPGLILAVEINGETAYMATSIVLTKPDPALLAKPDTGKAMTQSDFMTMKAEKEKEWKETRSQRRGTPAGHR